MARAAHTSGFPRVWRSDRSSTSRRHGRTSTRSPRASRVFRDSSMVRSIGCGPVRCGKQKTETTHRHGNRVQTRPSTSDLAALHLSFLILASIRRLLDPVTLAIGHSHHSRRSHRCQQASCRVRKPPQASQRGRRHAMRASPTPASCIMSVCATAIRTKGSSSSSLATRAALLRPVLSRIGDSELGLTRLTHSLTHSHDSLTHSLTHSRPALGADYYLTSLTSVKHREDPISMNVFTFNRPDKRT